MKLSREINRGIHETPEKPKEGEEGILHKIELNNESYFAKQWRGKHYENEYSGSLRYSKETDWKTGLSPFWFKVKYYEAQLVHKAFPVFTLNIEAGFDPRVSSDGESFEFKRGRPTTITKEVGGDKELREKRDAIIGKIYDELVNSAQWDQEGRFTGYRNRLRLDFLGHETNKQIQEIFGDFLGVRKFINGNIFTKYGKQHFINVVQKAYPDSEVAKMVEGGVAPTHAEFNYIPTEKTDDKNTKGVYIEVFIFDPKLLAKAILKQAEQKQGLSKEARKQLEDKINNQIERYYLLRAIDDLWDIVYHKQTYINSELFHDSEIGEALFKALDKIRQRHDQEKIFFDKNFFIECRKWLPFITKHSNKKDVLRTIEKLNTFIENYSSKQTKKAA